MDRRLHLVKLDQERSKGNEELILKRLIPEGSGQVEVNTEEVEYVKFFYQTVGK